MRELTPQEVLHLSIARGNVWAERSTGHVAVRTLVRLIDEMTTPPKIDPSLSVPKEK